MPGQRLNVDLCLVPASHEVERKLPAMSCSSDRMVVERVTETSGVPTYLGQVFADATHSYEHAMQAFVAASATPRVDGEDSDDCIAGPPTGPARRRVLRQEASTLQAQRRRRQEDGA
jgi:hypothetical protein